MPQQAHKPRLGKGLEALLPPKTLSGSGRTLMSVPVSDIKTNPFQPRITFNEDELMVLCNSIKTHGLTQPIVVRRAENGYELIAGERRLIACKMSQMSTIPVIIKNVTDQESLQIALVENMHREDLNAIEIAKGYQQLLSQDASLSHRDVSKLFGKSRESVTNTLRLLKLSKPIQEGLTQGQITEGHARALLSTDALTLRDYYFEKVKAEKWSVRRLERALSNPLSSQENTQVSEIKTISDTLSALLNCKVAIMGSLTKGKITLSYNNLEDFQRIIQKLK